jgi:hypothetical protein
MVKKNYTIGIAIAVLVILVIVAFSVKTPDNNRRINGMTNATSCTNEGTYGLNACCNPNMTQIPCASVEGPFKCMIAECGSVCTYCGNGVCGDGENWCNCPKDCSRFSF